jgi:hypothetical protein
MEGPLMSETPKEAARRLAAKKISDGFKPEALHEYHNADGNIAYWRIRLKHPNGDKWIRPMYRNGRGFELGEPDFANGKPLYRLPDLIARSYEVVQFVEGEWNVDHLAHRGVLATTSGSAESAKHADFKPLANRRVNIWPDNDEAGLRYAREVAKKLLALGATVQLVDISKLNLPPKGDCVDWLKAHPEATTANLDKLPMVPYAKADNSAFTADEWPEPQPIVAELLPVEPLPAAIIPEP